MKEFNLPQSAALNELRKELESDTQLLALLNGPIILTMEDSNGFKVTLDTRKYPQFSTKRYQLLLDFQKSLRTELLEEAALLHKAVEDL